VRIEEANRVLAKAAARAGGVRQLAAELNVSESILNRYIGVGEPRPDDLYWMIIDVILRARAAGAD
jgi:hypothetical protein